MKITNSTEGDYKRKSLAFADRFSWSKSSRKVSSMLGILQKFLKSPKDGLTRPRKTIRKKNRIQDGLRLRRCRRRWKIERFFAWFGNSSRIIVSCEHNQENFLLFVLLGFSGIFF